MAGHRTWQAEQGTGEVTVQAASQGAGQGTGQSAGQGAVQAENDGKMAAKSIRFLDFSASGAPGVHFGRPAGARRLPKTGLAAPEAPQDSAKRPKRRPLGDKRAAKETPGQPKGRQSGSKGRFLEHFGAQNGSKTAFSVNLPRKVEFAKIMVLPRQNHRFPRFGCL